MSDIKYEPHFVAFIDILGFKELIKASGDERKAVENIAKLDEALEVVETLYRRQWREDQDSFHLRMFSDCICVWVPAYPTNIDPFFLITAHLPPIGPGLNTGLRCGATPSDTARHHRQPPDHHLPNRPDTNAQERLGRPRLLHAISPRPRSTDFRTLTPQPIGGRS